jgi:hypothetical protein
LPYLYTIAALLFKPPEGIGIYFVLKKNHHGVLALSTAPWSYTEKTG